MRITVVGRRDERLLDRAGRDPADQVEDRAGLVVGAARPGAAERLLADHRAGRLVVDVEITGRIAQPFGGLGDRGAIGGQDGAGERVRRRLRGLAEHRLVGRVLVNVDREYRAEVLGGEYLITGVIAFQDGRADEVPVLVVDLSAGQEANGGPGARPLERAAVLVHGPGVDHRAAEQRQVLGPVAVGQRTGRGDEFIADGAPQGSGNVGARGGRALLALVLESAADKRGRDRGGVGRRVDDDEVLAAGLADKARIVTIFLDILTYCAPQVVEGGGRSREVDAGQVRMGQRHPGNRLATVSYTHLR